MTWHVIRVRSKDAQKQLARTSLNYCLHSFYLSTIVERFSVTFFYGGMVTVLNDLYHE